MNNARKSAFVFTGSRSARTDRGMKPKPPRPRPPEKVGGGGARPPRPRPRPPAPAPLPPSPGGRLFAISSGRPLKTVPDRMMAALRAASSLKSTYAKPRGRPVSLSNTILARTEPPLPSKNPASSASDTSQDTFLTKAVFRSRSGNNVLTAGTATVTILSVARRLGESSCDLRGIP